MDKILIENHAHFFSVVNVNINAFIYGPHRKMQYNMAPLAAGIQLNTS